jgi:hypothetical protein
MRSQPSPQTLSSQAAGKAEEAIIDEQRMMEAILSTVAGAADSSKETRVGLVLKAFNELGEFDDTGWVDGYAPEQYDEFHWDQFCGGIIAVGLGVLFLYVYANLGSSAPVWMVPAALGLFAVAAAGCFLSGFWRRYWYLIWWKKWIIVLSSLVAVCTQLALVLVWAFIGQLLGRGFGGSGSSKPSPDKDVAVDRDGNAYKWNAWRGGWEPKQGWCTGQERFRVKQGLFGPTEVRRGLLNMPQETEGGKRLYEPDD